MSIKKNKMKLLVDTFGGFSKKQTLEKMCTLTAYEMFNEILIGVIYLPFSVFND
jgi:hypothetical protein